MRVGIGRRIFTTYWYNSIFSGGHNHCLYVCCLFQSQEVFKKISVAKDLIGLGKALLSPL